jgi:succinate dehydrogenase/fumarate reductase flavoprotein subunit
MEQQLSADLLVIGGGFGGLFAAIHARKLGVRDVLIVDKGAVGLTGQSRMAAGATLFVHPGDDIDPWADAIFRGQNGLCNQDMVESFLANSTERLREIESLGVVYRGGAGEKYMRMPSRGLAPAMMTLFPQYRGMTAASAATTPAWRPPPGTPSAWPTGPASISATWSSSAPTPARSTSPSTT